MSYFKVKVEFEVDNGKRVRNVNKIYVVEAVSPTEAEVKMTAYLNKKSAKMPDDATGAFEVKDCVCTKFEDYIE
jgi:hypothetical protein